MYPTILADFKKFSNFDFYKSNVNSPIVGQLGLNTVRRLDFKQNCKYFWRDLRRIKEYASEIQNMYFSKSYL